MRARRASVLLVAIAPLLACGASGRPPRSAPPSATLTSGDSGSPLSTGIPGLDTADMDRRVSPGDDFFRYANGAWLAATDIPAGRAAYGPDVVLHEQNVRRLVDLVADSAKTAAPGSDAKKIDDYFASFMDVATIEAKGLAGLRPALDAVARIEDVSALAHALGATLRADVDVLNRATLHTDNLFGLWVAQDLVDPTRYSAFLLQGGLGMPDAEYYLDASPRAAGIRAKYEAHIAAMLTLAGMGDAAAKARRIFELERKIAAAHEPSADSENVERGKTHWTRGELAKRAPGIDWAAFLAGARLGTIPDLVPWHAKAIERIAALVAREPLATWREYLAFHAIDHVAPFLPRAFVEQRFAFYGRVLNGTPELDERSRRAMDATVDALGDSVGKLYVERYFPATERARAEDMVKNIIAAFGRRVDALDWMSPATKAKAKAKLGTLRVGVGYPNRWRDARGLVVVRGDALGNAQRASLFQYEREVAKLKEPVDRDEWAMGVVDVDAVNLPAMNAMNFPAAILQPPYFDPSRAAVLDYGAAGGVIGHEISHAFDDQGAQFDAAGKLDNWWTPDDLAHFQASAAKLAAQYDAYRPFPDASVDGRKTLSENIADVAGLAVAYDAYRMAYGGKEAPSAGGLTGDQQFFLSYAQSWRLKVREEAARQRLIVDTHAPAEYRADTVRNLDAWCAAFQVGPGQALYLPPEGRVRIW